jgi:DNA-binding transcriptional MocR family regulator
MSLNIIRGDSAATIAAAIEAALQSGNLTGGHRLPAIRDLAKTLKVSPVAGLRRAAAVEARPFERTRGVLPRRSTAPDRPALMSIW